MRLSKKAMPEIKNIRKKLPAGYNIEIGGTVERSKEGSAHIGRAMLISLFLIVLTLIVYFNAIQKTLIVLGTLPLALIGAFLGLWIMNVPLGFFAQLGLLALFGIVVNGAIVLFDFIGMLISERREDNGMKAAKGEKSYHGLKEKAFTDCVLDGCVLRVRPILNDNLYNYWRTDALNVQRRSIISAISSSIDFWIGIINCTYSICYTNCLLFLRTETKYKID